MTTQGGSAPGVPVGAGRRLHRKGDLASDRFSEALHAENERLRFSPPPGPTRLERLSAWAIVVGLVTMFVALVHSGVP
jgi:hypothetical protein